MSKTTKHLSTIFSSIPYGYEGRLIEVEGVITQGLPTFTIVGLGGKAISEARERVRSALKASALPFPNQRLTLNLAPAELKKDGVFLDLPIAISILVADGKLSSKDLDKTLFVGELSLDGHLRPVRGIINIVETARDNGFETVILPEENLDQAILVPPTNSSPVPPQLLGFKTLKDVYLFLRGQIPAPTPPKSPSKNVVKNTNTEVLNDICGQNLAKRALIIAITGHHNLLLSGPPGAGKTLLARAALELLPPPSTPEKIAITKLYSLLDATTEIATSRPFRSPHHTASLSSLIGGGPKALPGEISLANHGILFLDELPEYPRNLLESLRQPLEDRQISISRTGAKTTYPADFILIATMNPCPCGFSGDPTHECTCTPGEIQRYLSKLSGPLLDRIDLRLKVQKVKNSDLLNRSYLSTANVVKNKYSDTSHPSKSLLNTFLPTPQQIDRALARQAARYAHLATSKTPLEAPRTLYNASLSSAQVSSLLQISQPAKALLDAASHRLNLSARSYFKVIKVAQTIADLSDAPEILPEHIAEALSYRLDI